MGHRDAILAAGAAALALTGCTDPIFGCTEQAQCGDNGTCQPTGFCSFPDTDCDSGQRYGELAAEGLAGNCVPPDQASASEGTAADGSGSADDEGTSGDSGPDEDDAESTESAPGSGDTSGDTVPDGPDPYGPCMGNVCEYPSSVCVSNGPYAMCSPPCTVVGENTDECPSSPYSGFSASCLYTSPEEVDQSCFLTCERDTDCPGGSLCAGSVCSYLAD